MDATSPSPRPHPFPLARSVAASTAAAAAVFVAAALLLRVMWPAEPRTLHCAGFAAAVVYVTALASFVLMAILGPLGVMPTVYAFFGGMLLRVSVVLGAAMFLFYGQQVPGPPLAAALALCYIPQLSVEVAFVGRYLWEKDALRADAPGTSAAPAPGARAVEAAVSKGSL